MALVSDIIFEAFLDLGAVAPGETNTALELADAFLRLNQLVASWSTEELTMPNKTHTSFALTAGVDAYTLGVGGTLVTAAQPIRVTGALSRSGNFRSSMQVMSFEKFHATVDDPMAASTVLAKVLAADGSNPLINILVYPVPATGPGTLYLDYWMAMAQFATTASVVALPAGWERALHFNLAVELAPQYARQTGIDPTLVGNAQSSKASLVKLNADILGAEQQAPPQQQGGGQ
jgi:hypothetical protein